MAIFNEYDTNIFLVAINEKKTHEEYAREKFKKKYHFVPNSPGSSEGTIKVNGEQYKVDIDSKVSKSKSDAIGLDKKFFNLKGSHDSERRDAVLQHEIGHQKLHTVNSNGSKIDTKNRSQKMFRNTVDNSIKNSLGVDLNTDANEAMRRSCHGKSLIHRLSNQMSNGQAREFIYKNISNEDEFLANTSEEDQKRRDKDFETAKKYEKPECNHVKAEEFEADRYAANRTSKSAVKKALSNSNKLSKKESRKDLSEKDKKKLSIEAEEDYKQRSKALKDKDLQDAKTYK